MAHVKKNPTRRPPSFFEHAVITRVVEYGDSDAVVTFLTRDRGRLSGFARAAKKSKKRFGAGLFAGASGRIELRERAQKGFSLEGFQAGSSVFGLAEPMTLGRASYLVEITDKLMADSDPMPELFDWLCGALEILQTKTPPLALLRAYELQLMKATGYLPDLEHSSDLHGEPPIAIERKTGALVADPAAGDIPFGETERTIAGVLSRCKPDELPDFEREALSRTGRLFKSHLQRMSVGRLKSVVFLREMSAISPG